MISRLSQILSKLRNRHFLAFDVFFLLITPTAALGLRVGSFAELSAYSGSLFIVTVSFLLIKLGFFFYSRLYNRVWQYASIDELARITLAIGLSLFVEIVALATLREFGLVSQSFPRSVPIIESLLAFALVGGNRYSFRIVDRIRQRRHGVKGSAAVMIVGAGEAGVMIASEMQSNPKLAMRPVVFIDDDPMKIGLRIRGISVAGSCDDIPSIAGRFGIKQAVIAMPAASGRTIRRAVEICREADLQTATIPGVFELLDGTVQVSQLRPVQIEDLLRREPVHIDETAIADLVRGSSVLVTGGGGSIGSELCRQILKYDPTELVILGHGENSIFEIQAELKTILSRQSHTTTRLHCVIADIRDRGSLFKTFSTYRPDIVFHAAAHKHVPLMEAQVCEAVSNNVLGTQNVLTVAEAFDVERFVLVSTDKAVNPSSVMGATKRVAELLVTQAARSRQVPYVIVRFGNVLDSRGSVIPLFKQQIRMGGPVTVTDPEVRRYFMTIPEAVQLVLQSSTLAQCGEVYVLDMGDPIKIADLAEDLIRLSGLIPEEDIEIKFTNMRPGEKMFEELFLNGSRPTVHEKIFISEEEVGSESEFVLGEEVDHLITSANDGRDSETYRLLERIVPEYQSPSMLSSVKISETVEAGF